MDNLNNLTNGEIEKLAIEEQKQFAADVAIDTYDKLGTYFDELKKMMNYE